MHPFISSGIVNAAPGLKRVRTPALDFCDNKRFITDLSIHCRKFNERAASAPWLWLSNLNSKPAAGAKWTAEVL